MRYTCELFVSTFENITSSLDILVFRPEQKKKPISILSFKYFFVFVSLKYRLQKTSDYNRVVYEWRSQTMINVMRHVLMIFSSLINRNI